MNSSNAPIKNRGSNIDIKPIINNITFTTILETTVDSLEE